MANIAERLLRALRLATIPVDDVSIGAESNKQTWTVHPGSVQASAQPHIEAFDPNDPAHQEAELDAAVKAAVDAERLISAVVWCIIDTYSPPATVTKYQAARTKIINAYKAQPWKA